jgi:3-phosphoshikimate 1-carboxyvinyltransferase
MPTSSPSLKIVPINHPLNATVRVPGSKSLTNRALLIAALANGTTKITNALFSDDSKYFANALKPSALMFNWMKPITK